MSTTTDVSSSARPSSSTRRRILIDVRVQIRTQAAIFDPRKTGECFLQFLGRHERSPHDGRKDRILAFVRREDSKFRNARGGARRYDIHMNTFRITGLDPAPFSHLFGKSDEELATLGARRYVVDESPGFPDRVEMRDLAVGEKALLVNYVHLDDAGSPYRSSHAVFVREGATVAYDATGEIPEVLRRRLLSVRAFDTKAMMVAADVIDGESLRNWIVSTFDDGAVDFIDVHNAKPGCFAARVRRA